MAFIYAAFVLRIRNTWSFPSSFFLYYSRSWALGSIIWPRSPSFLQPIRSQLHDFLCLDEINFLTSLSTLPPPNQESIIWLPAFAQVQFFWPRSPPLFHPIRSQLSDFLRSHKVNFLTSFSTLIPPDPESVIWLPTFAQGQFSDLVPHPYYTQSGDNYLLNNEENLILFN